MRVAFRARLGICLSVYFITHTCSIEHKGYIQALACDILEFHRNLFSRDSLNILGVCAPIYLLVRQSDHTLHRCFYDVRKHKNNYKVPPWCTICANVGVLALPMVLVGARAFCARSLKIRVPAQIFLMSLPFTWMTKRVLKLLKWDCCLRPPRQEFSCFKPVYGGFPSGHMFEAVYMAMLFGSTYGRRWGAVLTGGSLFLGATFIVCNRHYVSQLVAGAILGFIYAHAARKLVDKKLSQVKMSVSDALYKFSYAF
jgi:hypothetical protein